MGLAEIKLQESGMKVLNGGKSKKKVVIKADGTLDNRYGKESPKKKDVSSKVFFLDREEIALMKERFLHKVEYYVNAGNITNELVARRNHAMFCCGINIGIRASDLINLKWSSVYDKKWNFKESYTFKPQKTKRTNKFVTIAYNEAFRGYIEEYRNELFRLKDRPDQDDYIFFSKKDDKTPINPQQVWKIMSDTADECGILKAIGSHTMRKTFGRNFYMEAENKDYALRMLQEWFGHSSPDVTLRYIGVTYEELIKFVNSVNL